MARSLRTGLPSGRSSRPAWRPGSPSARPASPRRAAILSVHTSPLDQPGTGDAGGMNVYVLETARRLAEAGVETEIFTRAVSSGLPPSVEVEPGVTVTHLRAGPLEELRKENSEMAGLVAQLTVLRREQANLQEMCSQVEVLRSDNALLQKKSARLPALQEEHQRLQVRHTHVCNPAACPA